MRDGAIIAMQQQNAKRGGLLLAQFEYLKTRQEALEVAEMSVSRWTRVLWFVQPARKWAFIDALQAELIEQSKAEMAQASAKAKIQIVPAASVHGG